MNDSTIHIGLRKVLVNQLKEKGITNASILQAIEAIPRHLFIESTLFDRRIYQDIAFPIRAGQTISRPYTVAFQTELLQIKQGDKVLEIGTGSGYQSAVLLHLKTQLYTIERQHELFKRTRLLLPKLGFNPRKFVFGDGYNGLPSEAPFKGILVTAGAATLPKALLYQLEIGGKLVIPLGVDKQIMTLFTRISEHNFTKQEFGEFSFVPMLQEKEY